MPETGQGRGTDPRTTEHTMIRRSNTMRNNRTPTPLPPESSATQFPTPAEAARESLLAIAPGSQRTKATKNPSPLSKVAKSIDQIISKHNPPGQLKTALTELMEFAKTAAEEEKGASPHVPLNAVKTMHDRLKADLLVVHSDLDAKISDLQLNQKKLLSTTENLSKSTEGLRSTTRELENKVVKVNDTTDKLATTTMTYRDAIMAKPANPNRASADPKVLNSLDKRARQILVGYNTPEENTSLSTSLLDLKDKANKTIDRLTDPFRPEITRIENVTRTRDGSLLLLLNSKEAAD